MLKEDQDQSQSRQMQMVFEIEEYQLEQESGSGGFNYEEVNFVRNILRNQSDLSSKKMKEDVYQHFI